MRVRDETAETPGEVHGAKNNERHVCVRASETVSWLEPLSGEPAQAWPRASRGQACRSGVSAVAVEAFMNSAG
jgi:hypothetical protein